VYITVLGDSALGLLTAQVMTRLNASVRVLGKSAEKLAVCERWGIKNRLESEVGRRADQDAVVDCTGAPDGLALAMLLVRPRGKIVLKSFGTQPGAAADLGPLVENEIDLIGSRSGPIADALAMLALAQVDTTGMVTRRMRFDDSVDALRAAAGPEQIKVVMEAPRA
jgi:threonine dehydrogenase-like Zn-dependent dehydrogenase